VLARAFFLFIIFLYFSSSVYTQCSPPQGAMPANPNIIYYAGGDCVFYDSICNPLLSVPASEAIWSCSPAKAKWVLVTPLNGGYYEFPNYTSTAPAVNSNQYLQPFWNCDTIFNELVLLTGVNSNANLMFKPAQILSVKNYNYNKTFVQGVDYALNNRTITQLSPIVSQTYMAQMGGGLLNTQHSSWTNVTYIPDRSAWNMNPNFGYMGAQLPNTMAKLTAHQPLIIQALGMSLTAGLNVSGFAGDPNHFTPTTPYMHSYIDLFSQALQQRFGASITTNNSSCGGKTAAWADQYCSAMVNPNNPDLVIIDMGMNDIWGTSNAAFKASIQSCMAKIKSACPQVEFILLSNMLPDVTSPGAPSNGDVSMYGFLDQLKLLEAPGVVCLDMTTVSDSIYQRKGGIHCTSNALHPNDYMARWYAQGLLSLFGQGNSSVGGKTYYVNTSGSNGNGLSIVSAWTSLAKLNAAVLAPGDTVLFEGGSTFIGHIEIDQNDGNNADKPIVFSSYGSGRAVIKTNVTNKCGFQATNTQGIMISELVFEGPGNGNQPGKDGILFYTTNASGYLSNLTVHNVEVRDFGYCGIRCYSNYAQGVMAGFKGVTIDHCEVHNCRENGIVTIGYDDQSTATYQHFDVKITNTRVYDITGYAASNHKGSGIVLSQVDSALIERCEVFNTGTANTACGGPGGIWAYAANHVTIQFCESHHNSSGVGSGCDGIGFDLDGGVTNSTIQYCYSHDNAGAGILLGNFWGARPWRNNTVRYNISINDARTNNSSITLFTAPGTIWEGLKFYHNTVFVTPSATNTTPTFSAFQMTDFGTSMEGVECYNNIFQTTEGIPLLDIPSTFVAQNPTFIGNLYWSSNNVFSLKYGAFFNSLATFRAAGPNCEHIGSTQTGVEGDPLLSNILQSTPVLFPQPNDSLKTAKISTNSQAKDAGIDLSAQFGIGVGGRDFWNIELPSGNAYDIGANELDQNAISHISNPVPEHSAIVYPNPANESIVIEMDLKGSIEFDLTISTIGGQQMFYTKNTALSDDYLKETIKTADWHAGVYFLSIKGRAFTYSGKLVIIR
jgi:lysophospholipase L1-like esterase